MIDISVLANELATDAEGLGYAAYIAAGNDQALADLLNKRPETFSPAKNWTVAYGYVPMATVLIWAASGPLAALSTGSSNSNSQVASACRSALLLFTLPSISSFNVLGTNESALLANLVAAGVLQQAQVDALSATATLPASRAEVLFGYGISVSLWDISKALRGN